MHEINWYHAKESCSKFLKLVQRTPYLTHLGAVHMSRASRANRADLSHENLYFSTT